MKKYIIAILLGLLFGTSISYAATVLTVPQGGTGASTLTGCLTGNGTGAITGTGSACGGAGSTPGGSNGQLQFNDSSSFGGAAQTFYNKLKGVLGLGTTTPAWLLQLASSTAPQLVLTDPNGGTDQKHGILRFAGGNMYFGSSTDALNSTSTTLTLATTSNVGIGTTLPTQKLTVSGGSVNLATQGQGFLFGDNSLGMFWPTGTNDLAFKTFSSERMRIISTGEVGIGTTSPAWLLQLNRGTAPQLALTDINGGLNRKHGIIRFANGNFYVGSSTDALNATSTAFSIASTTKVGIGTVNPDNN